jgi:hypothetical protein
VLKRYRGHSGIGVWKVSLPPSEGGVAIERDPANIGPDTLVRVRHAQRGSSEEELAFGAFLHRCESYFAGEGRVIDQAYQERLPEGMARCYLVHDRVAGFGHQAVNTLFPAPPGAVGLRLLPFLLSEA